MAIRNTLLGGKDFEDDNSRGVVLDGLNDTLNNLYSRLSSF